MAQNTIVAVKLSHRFAIVNIAGNDKLTNMNTPADKPSVRFERQLNVSPELVFDTLTNPKLMVVWWGTNVEFDIDLQVGGVWTIIRRERYNHDSD